jgi:hypothetical protein
VKGEEQKGSLLLSTYTDIQGKSFIETTASYFFPNWIVRRFRNEQG